MGMIKEKLAQANEKIKHTEAIVQDMLANRREYSALDMAWRTTELVKVLLDSNKQVLEILEEVFEDEGSDLKEVKEGKEPEIKNDTTPDESEAVEDDDDEQEEEEIDDDFGEEEFDDDDDDDDEAGEEDDEEFNGDGSLDEEEDDEEFDDNGDLDEEEVEESQIAEETDDDEEITEEVVKKRKYTPRKKK